MVVDVGSNLDERSLAVLEAAEVVLLPVYPEISALRAVHAFLDYVNEAGSIATKTTFVLNNMFAKELLKMRDVESGLGARVAPTLPYDPFLYLKAVNEGEPVVLGAPARRSPRPCSSLQRLPSARRQRTAGRRRRTASRVAWAGCSAHLSPTPARRRPRARLPQLARLEHLLEAFGRGDLGVDRPLDGSAHEQLLEAGQLGVQ